MNNSDDITARIQQWVIRSFPLAQQRGLGPHDSLLDSGIIDSLGTLEVVGFLEDEFGVQVTDEEMLADHFESVHAISQFVLSREEHHLAEAKAD